MLTSPGARGASGAETLASLAEAIDDFADARSVKDVQGLVHHAARRLTGADGATLIVREGGMCHYVDEDAVEPLWKGSRFPMENCISGWAMRHREPVVVEDVFADPRIPQDLYRPTFVKSLLVVPIGSRKPIGAIGMYWARRHRATEEQVAAAGALAAAAAVALDRARLVQEVERRRITESDLRELCERDPLTGVLNRRAWDQLLTRALRKGTQPLYIALIDLDHFKDYNDRNGHPAGDALLRRAAAAWRAAVRAGDVLARYGGEEFAVLLAGCEEDIALEIAERLRLATTDEQHVSVGVARWDGRQPAARLVERADNALYEAKRTGRNRVVLAA
ncbi:MAG TPA: sensor domain-containing diguanylate cyclase [Solirubrobacteraceae bacterium]|nr:sensor domain-containing diguanylate cyclase [Solirubrobacteraceae bacterium]